jgi:hypothetical protein
MIGEKPQRTIRGEIAKKTDGKGIGWRVQMVDNMAALASRMVDLWSGKVRNLAGELNPFIQLSQARDALRVSKSGQIEGVVEKAESGLYEAREYVAPEEFNRIAGEKISVKGMFEEIVRNAKAAGVSYDALVKEYGEILYGHRAYELRQKNVPWDPGLTSQQVDAAEQRFRQDEDIQRISQMMDALRFYQLDQMVKAGRLTADKVDGYKENLGYVPLNRIKEYEVAYRGTRGRNGGLLALKSIPGLEGGGSKKTVNPIENFSGLYDWMVSEAIRNDAASNAAKVLEEIGEAHRFKAKDAAPKDSGGVTESPVYIDGEPWFFHFDDPLMVPAFVTHAQELGAIWSGLQKGSHILRTGVTATPVFAVKQIFDDLSRIYAYSGVKHPGAVMVRALSGMPSIWINELRGKNNATTKTLENLGVVGTFDYAQESNLKNILHEAGAQKRTLGQAIVHTLEAGAKASDLAVRQALYEQVLKETKSEAFPEGDKAAAESAAREIINFSRRGASRSMHNMISVIPFFNAYAQGMDKLLTAATEGKYGKTMGQAQDMFRKRMTMLFIFGTMYALMMQDDDEYQNLNDSVRDKNWILPYGKELGFIPAIPVANELAYFFKVIPERMVRAAKLYGTEEEQDAMTIVSELLWRGLDVFSAPNAIAQSMRPIVENITNYSFHMGRPLESQGQMRQMPSTRFGMGTSDTAKSVSKAMEDALVSMNMSPDTWAMSPIKIENFVRGTFGSIGGAALAFTDAIFHPDKTDRPFHQQLKAQLTGAGALLKDPIGTRFVDEIYKLDKEVSQAHNTAKKLEETDPERLEEFYEAHKGKLVVYDDVQTIMKEIQDMSKYAREIDSNEEMSPEDRRKAINELKVAQNEMAKNVLQLRKRMRAAQQE